MASYFGRYIVAVDGKGRIAVPKRLRDTAVIRGSSNFMLNNGTERCLELYCQTDWDAIVDKLGPQNALEGEDENHFNRLFYSNAVPAPTDPQGRIIIPPFLMEEAGIDKEVLILGAGRKIEIWTEANFKEYLAKKNQPRSKVQEKLYGKGEQPAS